MNSDPDRDPARLYGPDDIRICIIGNNTDLSFETHYYGKEQNEYDGCGLGDGVEGHLNILEAPLGET